MANVIKLRKGLNINLVGTAANVVKDVAVSGTYGLCPDDFYGMKPKVVVHDGDKVKAGEALFINKLEPEMKVTSPVSGTVTAVVRGDRRKLLRVEVAADEKQESVDFGKLDLQTAKADAVKSLLLESGLFAFIKQRPYDVVASAKDEPKGIFVSAFNKMPLAADFNVVVKGREGDFLKGVEALAKIAKVYVGISPEQNGAAFAKTSDATVTIFDGPNPSGNVGVQINHISPVNKGEIVWTVGAEVVCMIGKLVNTGCADFTRVIAVAGAEIGEPCYKRVKIGAPIAQIAGEELKGKEHVRILNGNPLVGNKVPAEGFLAAQVTEVTAIPEGDDVDEVLGWIMPRINDFSTNRSYMSWLQGGKAYNLDARVKGGERHIIMSGEYDKMFPMDIFAGYLIKAIITGDIDRMEQLGIYEVAPEDFAVAEFVDSSKLELQRIVREGLDMLRHEMC